MPVAAINDSAARYGQRGRLRSGRYFHIRIHVGTQDLIRIWQFDSDSSCPRLRHQMRIDQRDFPGENPVGIAAQPDVGHLSDFDQGKIPLGDIGQHPDHFMVCDPEQNITRRRAHAVDGYAFHDLAVLWRRPAHVDRDFPGALDVGNKLLWGIEIFKTPARAFQGLVAYSGVRACIERREIFGGGARQALALMDMRAGRDVFHGVDEALETQRYDRFATLVFLNGARCTNHRIQSAPLGGLGPNASLLQFARTHLD